MDKINTILRPAILIAKPINTPKVVATPLPPLKFKNIVQLCPEIQTRPKIMRTTSSETKITLGAIKSPKKNTAIKPFRISKNNTEIGRAHV